MKTFKQYNESVKDLLQPKSNDEIIKALEGLSDNEKIKQIIRYQLDYSLLPRNSEGICTYYGHLNCSIYELTSLPDNLVVNGNLNCSDNKLTSLPENLVVNGDLDCRYNKLTSLPDNLIVNGYLNCSFNELTILPKNLTVNGDLDCRYNKLTSLPENLVVDGYLICYDNLLPKDIKKPKGVTGDFIL